MVLISNRTGTNFAQQHDTHVNLPGYVSSNSEQDGTHRWIHDPADEGEEKRVEGISLKETLRVHDAPMGPLEEEEECSRVEAEEVL